jgi:DNA topoisomerase-1
MFYKDGFLLKHTTQKNEDGRPLLKSVKKGLKIDMDKLEAGKYTLEELAETEKRVLGMWNGYEIELKTGKYGMYVEYDTETKVSLGKLNKKIDQIVLEDAVPLLEASLIEKPTSVLRVLSPTLSVRNGRYGPYIFYKTEKMKTPKFYDLKGFDQGFGNCDAGELIEWIKNTHIRRK